MLLTSARRVHVHNRATTHAAYFDSKFEFDILLLRDTSNEIINYRISGNGEWIVLVGIAGNTSDCVQIQGAMQLFSIERSVSQPIEGHAAAFAELKLDGHQFPAKLFTFAVRTATGAKVPFQCYSD